MLASGPIRQPDLDVMLKEHEQRVHPILRVAPGSGSPREPPRPTLCGHCGGMMDRRVFLKLSGVAAAAGALGALPSSAAAALVPAAPEAARTLVAAPRLTVTRLAMP